MRIVWIIVVVIVAILVWRGLEFVSAAGYFRELKPQPLICVSVGGVNGPEDVTIDRERALAYLSGYDRRAAARGEPKAGAIWTYDLSDPQAVPVNATPWADKTFLPHGISLYVDPDGVRRLFVVNHGGGKNTIEILRERNGKLVKTATIEGGALRSPNDIAAVDATRFYVTNDHFYPKGNVLRWAEDYLGLPLTNVLYYDGKEFRVVADGLAGANGVHLSEDGATLYVSASRGGAVHEFERDPDNGNIERRKRITVPGLPDNIESAQNGGILVALHPKPLKLLEHIKDAKKKSPSQVVRINPASGAVTTLYLDPGDELSGASTAAAYQDQMIIGAIAEPKFLDCTLK